MTDPHRLTRNKLGKKNTNNFEVVGSKSSQAAFTMQHSPFTMQTKNLIES